MIRIASYALASMVLAGVVAPLGAAIAATDKLPLCSQAPAQTDCHMHDRTTHIMQGNKMPSQPHANQEHRDWLREEQNGGRRS